MNVVVCRACQHEGLVAVGWLRTLQQALEQLAGTPLDQPARSHEVVGVQTMQCPLCLTLLDVSFLAGPGWETQPSDDDPRMAMGEAPSMLVPESWFRSNVDDMARRLEDTESQVSYRASLSSLGLRDLIELRKLARAAGRDLDSKDQALLRRFGEVYVASGERLPPDLVGIIGA
jgi:hypothetical protein